MMNTILNEDSAERLWQMFFPHLTRATGMALVEHLMQIRSQKNPV